MSIDTKNTATSDTAWNWLKSISRELYALDEVPLLGSSPPFPWEKLSEEFAKAFSLDSFKITPGELAWREKDHLMSGMLNPRLATQIAVTGMDGTCTFWIGQEDVEHLMAKVLQISEVVSELQSEDLVSSFHRFLGIETISLLNQLGYDPRLSFKITSFDKDGQETALCQDVKIRVQNEEILARIVISNEFLNSWRIFFQKPLKVEDTKSKLNSVETTVHVEAGKTSMMLSDLLECHPGDFLLLDQLYYDPNPEKCRFLITLEGRPLFRATNSDGSLKILEIPSHNEVQTPMVENVNPPQESLEDLHEAESQHAPDEENPFPDEEEDEEEEESFELVEQAQQETAQAQAAKPAEAPAAKPIEKATKPKLKATPSPSSGPLTPNDIPIQLIVEVAAIDLSVQKLLELAPGNLIDLQISPEQGVNLVVNSRVVGKGELVKIGETIGVRILQIGV